jgi:hypothetical protein
VWEFGNEVKGPLSGLGPEKWFVHIIEKFYDIFIVFHDY